ncbi:MAG: hypothetical protein WBV69_05760 [Candidatus Sulfotelmatobacter sp.]
MCVWIRTPSNQPTHTFRASTAGDVHSRENTYFRDDRVKQVVGLKLQLKGAWDNKLGLYSEASCGRSHVLKRQPLPWTPDAFAFEFVATGA